MKKGLRKINFEEGLILESKLNEIKFLGIPSGALLSYQISTASDVGYEKGIIHRLTQQLIFLKYYLKFIYLNNSNKGEVQKLEITTILLGLTSYQTRLTSWIFPIYEILEGNSVSIVSKDQIPYETLKRQISLSSFYLTKEEEEIWEIEFIKCFPKLKNEINCNVPKIFGKYFQFQLYINYIFQTRLILAFNRILDQTKPKVVLVDHDRQPWNSVLVLCSKTRNIQTYSLIHGLTLPITVYVPVIADNLLCWGKFHQIQFERYLCTNKLIDIGNFKISELSKNDPDYFLNLGRKPRIIFASTNFQFEQKVELARLFLDAAKELINYEFFFRLHPTESIDDYTFIKSKFSFCQIMSSKEMSGEESFQFGDIFVGHNSQYLVEAYFSKLPIIFFSPPEITIPIGLFEEISKIDKLEIITNGVGLKRMISNLIEKRLPKIKESNYFCSTLGEESLGNLKGLLLNSI